MSKLTAASIRDMSDVDAQQEHWLANFILNTIFRTDVRSPFRQQIYNFLRRSHAPSRSTPLRVRRRLASSIARTGVRSDTWTPSATGKRFSPTRGRHMASSEEARRSGSTRETARSSNGSTNCTTAPSTPTRTLRKESSSKTARCACGLQTTGCAASRRHFPSTRSRGSWMTLPNGQASCRTQRRFTRSCGDERLTRAPLPPRVPRGRFSETARSLEVRRAADRCRRRHPRRDGRVGGRLDRGR
jgi:hypothetical protein